MTDHRAAPPDRKGAGRLKPDLSGGDDDRMTEGQRSYLARLCEETGERFDENLSIAEASRRIEQLEGEAPRPS